MDNELSRMRKEAVIMNMIYFTNICLERRGKAAINLGQGSRSGLCADIGTHDLLNAKDSKAKFRQESLTQSRCLVLCAFNAERFESDTRVARNSYTVDLSTEGTV